MNTLKHYAIAGFVLVTLVGSLLNWKHRCAEMRAMLAEAEALEAAGPQGYRVPDARWVGPRFAEADSGGR